MTHALARRTRQLALLSRVRERQRDRAAAAHAHASADRDAADERHDAAIAAVRTLPSHAAMTGPELERLADRVEYRARERDASAAVVADRQRLLDHASRLAHRAERLHERAAAARAAAARTHENRELDEIGGRLRRKP